MNTRRWEWSGFYYDGRTAARESVTLTLEGNRLCIRRADGTTRLWPLSLVRQTQGSLSTEQVRIEFGDEPAEAVLVNDPRFAAEIRAASPEAKRVVRRQWKTSQVLTWSASALAIAGALYVFGGPAAAAWAANRLPPSWEVEMGKSLAKQVSRFQQVCADADTVAELRALVTRLAEAGPPSPYPFHVLVLRDTIANAFAAPGGYIFLNSGLLTATETPEELAGVLAHEMQHVTLRHSTRAILREVPVQVAIAGVTGGSGIEATAGTIATLGMLRYRRADEAEADREGMRLLNAAAVDASGMISFMRTLETKHGDVPTFARYLSSHPRTVDRVAELEAFARKTRYESRPLLDAAGWQRLRAMECVVPIER
jgi:beta-barrel assembly-enhancing protease